MTPTRVFLTRTPTAAEAEAFRRADIPPGLWAALYAAPIAALVTEVVLGNANLFHEAKDVRWPWAKYAADLPGELGVAALTSVTAESRRDADGIVTAWLRKVLPPFSITMRAEAIRSAVKEQSGRISTALELLAWHLAKDVPPATAAGWLSGCARSGVLAPSAPPPWLGYPIGHPELTASALADDLRKEVDAFLPLDRFDEPQPGPVERTDELDILIDIVPRMAANRPVEFPGWLREKLVRLPRRPGGWEEWLAATVRGTLDTRVTPPPVIDSAREALAVRLAALPWDDREAQIGRVHQLTANHARKGGVASLVRGKVPTPEADNLGAPAEQSANGEGQEKKADSSGDRSQVEAFSAVEGAPRFLDLDRDKLLQLLISRLEKLPCLSIHVIGKFFMLALRQHRQGRPQALFHELGAGCGKRLRYGFLFRRQVSRHVLGPHLADACHVFRNPGRNLSARLAGATTDSCTRQKERVLL